MFSARIVAIALAGASLAACAGGTIGGPKEDTGTLIGAGAGALLGSQIGGDSRARVAGAVGGALIGGLIGNRIGAALDDEDKSAPMPRKCRHWRPVPQARRSLGAIRTPAAMARSCRARPISSKGLAAASTPTRSTSTASRRPRAARPAATRTEAGIRSARVWFQVRFRTGGESRPFFFDSGVVRAEKIASRFSPLGTSMCAEGRGA